MRAAVLMAIALCAPGCHLVFKLEDVPDKVPHIPAEENEEPGDQDLVISGDFVSFDTTEIPNIFVGQAEFEIVRQDRADTDVMVMRVGNLTVAEGVDLVLSGELPLIIVARTVQIDGVIEASAHSTGTRPGPGSGRPGRGDPGEGGAGVSGPNNINTGGGGGGHAKDGGAGGEARCGQGTPGGAPGQPHGDEALTFLRGGGAGGSGLARCPDTLIRGGYGGGAIQISATESITISPTGQIRASGGGGGFGAGSCLMRDDAGSGGGAGGAIYLDAPVIRNEGKVEAFGGGGGGGGDDSLGGGAGTDGIAGHFGNETVIVPPAVMVLPSVGGTGQLQKGTDGGNGAREGGASAGAFGDCALGQLTFNTGGGGGAVGRIVVRVVGEVSPFGTIGPTPIEVEYPDGL